MRATSGISTRELAAITARALGADGRPEVIDYLTDAFDKVVNGGVGNDPHYATQLFSTGTVNPLAAARVRGRRVALEEYRNPDNLTLLDARDYAGRNERAINEDRQKGALYALLPAGKERGFRYPKWQFDAEGSRLRAVLEPFVTARVNSWSIHSFMRSKREELDGRSPADVILNSNASLARVVDLALQEVGGEQGAS
ncbi:hypothetical protein AWB76_04850 [Caballeronia temeraria]|uniref:Uncharacterized protein n=1 Tax=Caballeronia temeraria TaxID=1777137 RepID=A0A158BYK5_9BURK|nr:hypothetical protein [Caballeronia temeraria]SAK75071.1 hypothetical protein AWB76_04850 [Caballeronia temeraria]